MKRDLHAIRVVTDESGIVVGVLIDGQPVRGCTGITASVSGPTSFLNVTLSMEAALVEGLAGVVTVKRPAGCYWPRCEYTHDGPTCNECDRDAA